MTGNSLSSWADGPTKTAIHDFVARVTDKDSPDFVPPSERIATFDNDGTLWCEQPFQVQIYFLLDRLDELAEDNPDFRKDEVYRAFLDHGIAAVEEFGKEGLMKIFAATHAGMDEEEFEAIAREWFAVADHPTLDRLFTALTYEPQRELLDYLRANGFRIFIVSGGGVDFMRAFAEDVYGVPRDHVIGSSEKAHFEMRDGRAQIIKMPGLNSFDDREEKVININLHIGRRPIFAFGNSDGDLAMLRYCATGSGPRLSLLLHHDDADREYAYDRDFALSPLSEALEKADDYGLTLVSMKRDWNRVFH